MTKTKHTADFDWRFWESDERDIARMSKSLCSRIVFQMFLINRFEHEILRLQKHGCVWGPVHTSVGQEALAAAMIAGIGPADQIAGSHRAHHQFLAKALNAVWPEDWEPFGHSVSDETTGVVKRTMAEILGLSPGFCGGRGGSMHLRSVEYGILGTNAIVGGGIPPATGAAFASQYTDSNTVVFCFLGDGATNQGSFHEALNLAGLWKLPIVYVVENNLYAVATSANQASAVADMSVRAISYNMPGISVPGNDIGAMYAVAVGAAERARSGQGPTLIEARCYRHYHHAGDVPGSSYGYRSQDEEEAALKADALRTFPEALKRVHGITDAEIELLHTIAADVVKEASGFCTEGADKPEVRVALQPDPKTVGDGLRSSGSELTDLPYRERESFDKFGELEYSSAIAAVTGRWMERDGNVFIIGEEVANFGGGAYGATQNLPAKYPNRVINTPISEAGFTGIACGAAISGLKPIVEIMYPDFALVAADQLFNQIGKARHMYGDTTDLPLVARTRVATGCGYGGQHSMDPSGLYSLFRGWRIVAPADAFDYIGLFNTAMHSLDPVLMIEHHSLYKRMFPVPESDLDYCIPFGKARILIEGGDITVVTYSSMVRRLETLKSAFDSAGVSIELVDLRTIDVISIDYEMIGRSLQKTGAVVMVEEAADGQGIGRQIAAEITERFFNFLDAPPGCLASLGVPPPVSRALEAAALLSDETILSQVGSMARREWK